MNSSNLWFGSEVNSSIAMIAELQHSNVEIKQTGYNSFGKYHYATLDDILKAIQPYLAKHKCVVLWSEDQHVHDVRTCYDTEQKDSDYYVHTDTTLTCMIVSATNPDDFVSTQSHGYGINKNADKTCKATTIGKRYSLNNLLGLQQVNDEDTDNSKFDVASQQSSFSQRFSRKTTDKRNSVANKLV